MGYILKQKCSSGMRHGEVNPCSYTIGSRCMFGSSQPEPLQNRLCHIQPSFVRCLPNGSGQRFNPTIHHAR
jgi:hypothetical protein